MEPSDSPFHFRYPRFAATIMLPTNANESTDHAIIICFSPSATLDWAHRSAHRTAVAHRALRSVKTNGEDAQGSVLVYTKS
jgi:hypothetical protein